MVCSSPRRGPVWRRGPSPRTLTAGTLSWRRPGSPCAWTWGHISRSSNELQRIKTGPLIDFIVLHRFLLAWHSLTTVNLSFRSELISSKTLQYKVDPCPWFLSHCSTFSLCLILMLLNDVVIAASPYKRWPWTRSVLNKFWWFWCLWKALNLSL